MNTRTPIVLSLSIVLLGLLIPIVPRLVVPLIWPYPYDDPYVGAGLARIGPLLAWNALPFVLLALVAYVVLTRAAASGRRRVMLLGGVCGAMVSSIALGVWIHTPRPDLVGFNFGVTFFPLYMLVLMPAGFGLGALLGWQFGISRLVSRGAVGVVFGLIALRHGRLLPLIIGHVLWNVVLIGVPARLAAYATT